MCRTRRVPEVPLGAGGLGHSIPGGLVPLGSYCPRRPGQGPIQFGCRQTGQAGPVLEGDHARDVGFSGCS